MSIVAQIDHYNAHQILNNPHAVAVVYLDRAYHQANDELQYTQQQLAYATQAFTVASAGLIATTQALVNTQEQNDDLNEENQRLRVRNIELEQLNNSCPVRAMNCVKKVGSFIRAYQMPALIATLAVATAALEMYSPS